MFVDQLAPCMRNLQTYDFDLTYLLLCMHCGPAMLFTKKFIVFSTDNTVLLKKKKILVTQTKTETSTVVQ